MDTGFRNPIDDKAGSKSMKSPWDFTAPHYDQRSSCYVSAGTDHGVGKKTPVGSLSHNAKDVIPKGRVKTLETYPEK